MWLTSRNGSLIDRGDIVLVAAKGTYTGKPRPWVVLQDDDFRYTDSIMICAFTHVLVPDAGLLRIDVMPDETNGLRLECQLQVEKIATVRRIDIGRTIGRLDQAILQSLGAAVSRLLGLQ